MKVWVANHHVALNTDPDINEWASKFEVGKPQQTSADGTSVEVLDKHGYIGLYRDETPEEKAERKEESK